MDAYNQCREPPALHLLDRSYPSPFPNQRSRLQVLSYASNLLELLMHIVMGPVHVVVMTGGRYGGGGKGACGR
eukprot:SM011570S24274  [mRNA]  locus=s11570:19:354:- [translate_table: standard]